MIYVDSSDFRREHVILCRLWADTPQELEEICARLEIPERFIITSPEHKLVYVMASQRRKQRAIKLGAKLVDELEFPIQIAKSRGAKRMLRRLELKRSQSKKVPSCV